MDGEGNVELWNLAEGRQIGVLRSPADRPTEVYTIGMSSDGNRLATITSNAAVEVWDLRSMTLARPPIALPYAAYVVGFDADGYLILGGETESAGRRLTFWDLDAGRETGSMRLSFHATGELSPDRKTLALDSLAWAVPTRIATTAGQWRDHFCRVADRAFQAYEIDVLPPGVDPGSPCRP